MERAIVWMLDHRDRWPAMSAAARRLVAERFSLDAVADQYVALFREVVGNGQPTR